MEKKGTIRQKKYQKDDRQRKQKTKGKQANGKEVFQKTSKVITKWRVQAWLLRGQHKREKEKNVEPVKNQNETNEKIPRRSDNKLLRWENEQRKQKKN